MISTGSYTYSWGDPPQLDARPAPAVSVLLPVFNAEKYLEIAVRSILHQTFRDFELLVIDDGSTDGSRMIIERLGAEDDRIRWFSRANSGLIVTLNELLSDARGEFVARMDADDSCHPERFQRQVDFLRSHPQTVAVGSRVMFIDDEGAPLAEAMDRYSHEEIDAELLRPGLAIVHPSVMARITGCRSIGGFKADYKHAEDLDFFLRLSEVGRLANLPQPLLQYRVHASSVSHRHVVEQSISASRAVKDALRRRGLDASTVASRQLPTSKFESKAQLHRKWAWWAFSSENIKTARRHAFLAARLAPASIENWRLLATLFLSWLKLK